MTERYTWIRIQNKTHNRIREYISELGGSYEQALSDIMDIVDARGDLLLNHRIVALDDTAREYIAHKLKEHNDFSGARGDTHSFTFADTVNQIIEEYRRLEEEGKTKD